MSTPQFLQLHQIDSSQLAAEAVAGLLAPAAMASPKFLYDPLGSRLFDRGRGLFFGDSFHRGARSQS